MTDTQLIQYSTSWLMIGSPQAGHRQRQDTGLCVCVPVGFSDIYSRVRSLFNHCPWVSLGCFACSNFRQLMPYLVLTNRSPIHGTLSWDGGFRAGLAVLTGVKPTNKRSRAVCTCACRCVRICLLTTHISSFTSILHICEHKKRNIPVWIKNLDITIEHGRYIFSFIRL